MLAALLPQWLKRSAPPGPRSILDQLRATPGERLDDAVRVLLARHPAEEVRAAMVELVKEAPLEGFQALKRVYFKHFAS
jgi:hypothetical protein